MVEQRVPDRVYVTEAEYLRLLERSTRETPLLASFGGGRVWLDDVESNAWAFTLLVEWRGLNVAYDY